jgi:YbbR domain-containing protein
MPFQDTDDVTAEQARTPTALEKILRRIFIEDWSLKLLSIAITLVLWLVVTGQNEPITTHMNLQLNFVRPQSLEISNDPPKSVEVTLLGSKSKLDNLTAPDLVATVDITDQRAGERMLRLSEKAQLSLPPGIRVMGFVPSAVPVRLEPIVEKELIVEPKVEGKPSDGYEVYSITPDRKTVTVRGPASHVNPFDKASTETIWLSNQKESFQAQNVAIEMPDPKVELLDPGVNVQVEIGEKRIERMFSDVSVVNPTGISVQQRRASAIVQGTEHDLESLDSSQIKIVLNQSLEPQLLVPDPLKGRLVLKQTNPTKFTRLK